MIALAAQIRIVFVLMAVGLAAYFLWRLVRRFLEDPRARAWLARGGLTLLRTVLMRGGLALMVLLRLLRWFR